MGSFNGRTTGNGTFEKFEHPAGVAVNETTGDVYVVSAGKARVEWFNSTGTSFEGQFNGSATPAKAFLQPDAIAIDNTCRLLEQQNGEVLTQKSCESRDPSNGDVYVADTGHSVVDKFSAAGEYLGQLTGVCERREEPPPCSEGKFVPFAEIDGIAVDASGELWVATSHDGAEAAASRFNDRVLNRYRETADLASHAGVRELPGFAADPHNDLYASFEDALDGERYVVEFNDRGTILDTRLDPQAISTPLEGGATHGIAVELTSDEAYVDDVTSVARFSPDGEAGERVSGAPLTSPGGVAVNSTSGQLYAVDSSAGVVDEFAVEPAGPPLILGESAANVASSTAVLQAQLDPRGSATTYQFEYGACATLAACPGSSYEPVPASSAMAGPDFEVHPLAVTVQGLAPHTAYHFRVVAESTSPAATVTGEEHTLVTQSTGGELVLPDGRAWELVSPADKNGALISPTGAIQAAAAGGAVSYLASGPIEPEALGNTGAGVQVLSTRGAAGGWSSHDLTFKHTGATGGGHSGEYRLFSRDLSTAAVQPHGSFTALSNEATEQTAYLRDGADGTFTPLVDAATVPSGTVFGGMLDGECPEIAGCGPKFRGATPDLSHVVLSSSIALTAGAPAGEGLYEWAAGALSLLGSISEAPGLAFHAISSDGSRVIFSGASEGHEGLLMQADGKTAQIDAVAPGCDSAGCVAGGGEYQAASSDASRVLFTDAHDLTEDAGATVNAKGEPEADLYVCEAAGAQAGCDLHDLTPQPPSGHAAVVGVLGASADGTEVYFAANGILNGEAAAAGAVHGSCKAAKAPPSLTATCNLYEIHYNGVAWEAPQLLAVLSAQDQPDWSRDLQRHTARVAPDGGSLAFMSQRSLTGYDNEDITSARRGERMDEEVYLYRRGAGIVCASCNPTGQRPAGVQYSQIEAAHGGLAGGEEVWPATTWIAASVPGWEAYEPGAALYQPRYLSNGGRLFFDASDPLVPQDANASENVYEYEPDGYVDEGVRRCDSTSAGYSEYAGGCIGLISSGDSSRETIFLDASENGDEAFFLTSARLLPQDTDSAYDVYDARECTGAAPCAPGVLETASECSIEASCKPSPQPKPALEPSPSTTFKGEGNLPPNAAGGVLPSVEQKQPKPTRAEQLAAALKRCRKDTVKAKRHSCEQAARKKFGAATKPSSKKPGKGRS
jgi:DNA-binding beta-propeller fold protein YncE